MNSSITSIALCGYYGKRNTGDDMFVMVGAWGVRRWWDINDIYIISNEAPQLPFYVKNIIPKQPSFRWHRALKVAIHLIEKPNLVFAGGSIFTGQRGGQRSLIMALHDVRKINMGAIGVSVGPFINMDHEKRACSQISKLKYLVVRDKKSFEIVNSWELPLKPILGFDLGGLLPQFMPINQMCQHKNRLGVIYFVPNNLTNREANIFNCRITQALLILQKKGVDICFICFNGSRSSNDYASSVKIQQKLYANNAPTVIPYNPNPLKAWQEISKCTAVLSVRMHGGIYATMAQIPFVQLEYHEKCKNFLDHVEQPGELRVSWDVTPRELASALEKAIDKKKENRINIDRLIRLAQLNFTSKN